MAMKTINYAIGLVIAGVASGAVQDIYGSQGHALCESQAARVNASTPTTIFNRCTKELPDGTVLRWDKYAQHQKDLQSGVALELK